MSFLNGVDKRSRDIMCKYMTYSVSANLLYPVERCLNFYRAVDYLEIMCLDESFLLSSLLSACCMNDYVMGQSPSALTIRHLRKLLMRLNSQLSNVNSKNIWAVIFTVLTLGNVASVFSDYNAATMHIQGLERIVELHCGKEYLREYPKFHFKIDRLDLSRSVSIGKRPLFRPHSVVPEFSWRPFFAGSNPLPAHLTSALSTPMDTFPKFTVVYNDLRHLTNLINDHIAAGTLMSTEMFHSAIHSIQSRIIYLEGMMEDGVAECLRLGMLACLTTTFRLPGRKMEYTYLKERLRDMLQGVRIPSLGAQRMVFWALMMGIVAVFEADEQWIPHVWSRVVGERMNWEEARKRLRNGIWITCVHDAPAEQVFLKLELRRMEVGKW
ncbi:hypothetical protein P280DRAFT_472739 [Massarina eburnea CBS 473.64]|uniref:Uncharacterized protein n=1 Tax=Massarina eburnea CBS 473.64 TaxID=1395130 RepID=A0A6A6RS50_9PLEO|nr:hypothetical protein P280DRAFT_472739 [Massarina eburnea CBS 473.64]